MGYDDISGGSVGNLASPLRSNFPTINGSSFPLGTPCNGQVFVYNPNYEGLGYIQAFVADSSGNFLTASLVTNRGMMTTLRDRLVKIGAKIVRHGRSITFQMAEVMVSRGLFQHILDAIAALRPLPPARC